MNTGTMTEGTPWKHILKFALAMGFSAGNGVVVARFYGAGNEKSVRATAATGILFLILIAWTYYLSGRWQRNANISRG